MSIPNGWVMLLCALCTLIVVWGIISERRWHRTHLSNMSVKYAVDALTTGICCYDEKGRVLLRNRTMESLHWAMAGSALLNGISYESMVFSPVQGEETLRGFRLVKTGEKRIVLLPDGKVYEFSREELADPRRKKNGKKEYILTAAEVTQEYRQTQMLLDRQETVTELNRKLRAYNQEILSVITAKEVLNAKVKIHDELGATLLRIRKYLEHANAPETPEWQDRKELERSVILDSLQQNLTFLQREPQPGEQDEYALLLRTAQQLDVSIEIEGALPEEEKIRTIFVTALHECLTNTIRHARGNRVRVTISEDGQQVQARYTNNGAAPESEIAETGGLRSLRALVEQGGGTMEIRWKGGFLLMISLNKGGAGYGI